MRVFKWLIILVIVGAIIAAGAAFVYWKLYGKNIIESTLSKAIGRPIKYESFELDVAQNTVKFKGFRVPGRRGFRDEDLFSAGELTAVLDREELKENKKVIFDQVVVKNGTLNIERNRAG
ncbi:hypothetical protein ACFL3J_00825, partial [Candidatus Omnitrophota bacterium]